MQTFIYTLSLSIRAFSQTKCRKVKTMKIKARFGASTRKWVDGWELEYIDKVYEVYSFRDSDGIWGSTYDDFQDAIDDLKKYEIDLLSLWEAEAKKQYPDSKFEEVFEFVDVELDLPFSFIEAKGYSIRKNGKIVQVNASDMGAMISEGVWYDHDGNAKELDADDSPLKELGLI
jgi:hypothetical protein